MTDIFVSRDKWPVLPEFKRLFLSRAIEILSGDRDILGIGAHGSFARGDFDAYSDLDLRLLIREDAFEQVFERREKLAAMLGHLLAAYGGEHVGEPRLLICLYAEENELLSADFKFAAPSDMQKRDQDPVILFDRDGSMRRSLEASPPVHPFPDLQWIEDRFWPWVHYTSRKIGRGEVFEAAGCCNILLSRVVGPMASQAEGRLPRGLRRLELLPQAVVDRLKAMTPDCSRAGCLAALRNEVSEYLRLRDRLAPGSLVRNSEAERLVIAYLERIGTEIGAPEWNAYPPSTDLNTSFFEKNPR